MRQRYFLIGEVDGKNQPLVVVLPGGDGGADFLPFVKNIAQQALPKGFLVAQAVAPRWREDEERLVWPTAGLPDAKAKFTTEDFVEAIVADVKKRASVDVRRVFALAWSSGGPAAYATALRPKSALRGALVAMSVFKPEQLPAAKNAKGKAFWLLHSPTDFIPMRFPENAVKTLRQGGATVELTTYEGGHGWHGDVFGTIASGMAWLVEHAK